MTWLSACVVAWCAIGWPDPQIRVGYAQSSIDKHGSTQRFVIAEFDQLVFAGFVQQSSNNAFVAGSLPIEIRIGSRLRFGAGGMVSTARIPARGTHANFLVTTRLDLPRRLFVTYVHGSNAGLALANPSFNAFGAGVHF